MHNLGIIRVASHELQVLLTPCPGETLPAGRVRTGGVPVLHMKFIL